MPKRYISQDPAYNVGEPRRSSWERFYRFSDNPGRQPAHKCVAWTLVAGVLAIRAMTSEPAAPLIFPRWANKALAIAALTIAIAWFTCVALLVYLFAPSTQRVGYQPLQPVPYSHQQHVGQLGMDCRYCHNTVEVAAMAAVPPTQTCMNCHARILPNSEQLLPVRLELRQRPAGPVGAGARSAELRLLQPQRPRRPRRRAACPAMAGSTRWLWFSKLRR